MSKRYILLNRQSNGNATTVNPILIYKYQDQYNTLISMKLILLLLLLVTAYTGQISSWDTTVTYNYYGYPLSYNMFFRLDSGMGATDYLHIIWPEALHTGTDKTQIKVTLISNSNNFQITQVACIAYPASSSNFEYFVTFGTSLAANKWYQIQVYPNANPSLSYGLIQMQTTSDYNTNYISYDQNFAFGYYYVQSVLGSSNTMSVAVTSSASTKNMPSQIYSVSITLTPSLGATTGGNFSMSIYYDNTVPAMNSGTTLLDFGFAGLCQSTIPATCPGYPATPCTAAILNYCTISSDLSTISFSVSSLTASYPITITTQVTNPIYVSTRGIRAYWVDYISGLIKQNGYTTSALSVTALTINNVGTNRVLMHWGIYKSYTDSYVSNVNLGIYKAASTSIIGPLNSFNNGFSISQTPPINAIFKVQMTLNALGVLQGSIVHNLPAAANSNVFCKYSSPYLTCYNVGAFINTNYRYFISGKAYFSNSLTGTTLALFGDVSIISVVSDTNGNSLSVNLFTPLATGETISITTNSEYLDNAGNAGSGWHSSSNSLGYTRVVSYTDDLTLSSTANAVNGFWRGANSSVGIVPDWSGNQQLLFFLNVPQASMDTGLPGSTNSNTYFNYQMKLLYNSKVIGFASGASNSGLDFVGYSTANGTWGISTASCYQDSAIVCQKYADTVNAQTNNAQTQVNDSNGNALYGIYTFNCGGTVNSTSLCGTSCNTLCRIFNGQTYNNLYSGVMSMRQVTFPTGYQSPLYGDSNVLDFIISFYQGSTLISNGLINAYTIKATKMANIKYSYVNYYDDTTYYNKGIRIPTMARIAGGVLPSESLNATVVAVFFDEYMDASTFFTNTNTGFAVGCSTGTCLYYPNSGVQIPRDIWHSNRRIEFYNIPALQNEFNLLVPITQTLGQPPKSLNIAFMNNNYTSNNVTGMLNVLSVYRLFGPVITGTIYGIAIGTLNNLASVSQFPSLPNLDFNTTSWNGYQFALGYSLNVSNINSSPPNNSFLTGSTAYNGGYAPSFGYGVAPYYGAGITITSFQYNIFASATVQYSTPPVNTSSTCSIFSYVYNEIQNPGSNVERSGKTVYTAFCPIDSNLTLNTAAANILLNNPQYPSYFVSGFPLQNVLAYAYSDVYGNLLAYKLETQAISYSLTCSTSKLSQYYPNSNGKQRSTFSINFTAITMAPAPNGYPSLTILLTLPSTTVLSGSSLTITTPTCQISLSYLTCTTTYLSTTSYSILVTLNSASSYSVSSFTFNLYATSAAAFGNAANYTTQILLPQYSSTGGYTQVFGTLYTTQSSYASCSNTFTVATTSYGTAMIYNNFTAETINNNLRGHFGWNFATSSYREVFYSTSYFNFGFGIMSTPNSNWKTYNNFRCIPYNNNNGTYAVSTLFKSIDFTTFSSVKLYPKAEIANPSSMQFTLLCLGGGMPDGLSTGNLTMSWTDSGNNLQTATQIANNSISFTATTAFSTAPIIIQKRFNSQGVLAFYSFKIAVEVALTQNARFYFEFPYTIASSFNRQAYIECYTRTTNDTSNDANALSTFCQFIGERRLQVWNNIAITSGYIYIDIFGIQQPKVANINGNSYVSVSMDTNTVYSDGVSRYGSIVDTVPVTATGLGTIIITSSSFNTNYIRTAQTITLGFTAPATTFSSSRYLYLNFPASYAIWVSRNTALTTSNCILYTSGTTTPNLATACTYISTRLLRITVSSTASTSFTLILNNIISTPFLPTELFNSLRFGLFCATTNEASITHYSFQDKTAALSLISNSALVDISWISYSVAQTGALSLTQVSVNSVIIYLGYYNGIVEIRQSIYPSNFLSSLTFAISNQANGNFLILPANTINLGYSTNYIRLAAVSTLQTGQYILQFTKTGDTNNYYTQFPPLTVIVQNTACSLTTKQSSYTVPVGGFSLPIIIEAFNCIPITSITVSASFNPATTQLAFSTDLSNTGLTSSSMDGRIYLVLQHTPGVLQAGATFTMSISFGGTNGASYNPITNIAVTMIDPSLLSSAPTATALSNATLLYNTATFNLQCNAASTIYWGIGIYPSILNTGALGFQARIISGGNGLLTNFSETLDYYWEVYGVNYVSTANIPYSKTVYGLKSNSNYLFKYFCVNQMNHISDGQIISFNSTNNGAYLMKIIITFSGSLNYGQLNALACSLASNFVIPYNRVVTSAISYCGNTANNVFYSSDSASLLVSANSNGQYIYNFYVQPDYTLAQDTTNLNIMQQLSVASFSTTILTSTSGYATLPTLVQMQTADVQLLGTPTYSVYNILAGLTGITLNATITNMNGFIVVAVMNGVFLNNMTLPTNVNVKQGLFQSGISLLQVQMQYVAQNFNVTFTFQNLSVNTQYSIFYFATVDDPSLTALSTTVTAFNVTTLTATSITVSYEPWHCSLLVLLVLMVIMG